MLTSLSGGRWKWEASRRRRDARNTRAMMTAIATRTAPRETARITARSALAKTAYTRSTSESADLGEDDLRWFRVTTTCRAERSVSVGVPE